MEHLATPIAIAKNQIIFRNEAGEIVHYNSSTKVSTVLDNGANVASVGDCVIRYNNGTGRPCVADRNFNLSLGTAEANLISFTRIWDLVNPTGGWGQIKVYKTSTANQYRFKMETSQGINNYDNTISNVAYYSGQVVSTSNDAGGVHQLLYWITTDGTLRSYLRHGNNVYTDIVFKGTNIESQYNNRWSSLSEPKFCVLACVREYANAANAAGLTLDGRLYTPLNGGRYFAIPEKVGIPSDLVPGDSRVSVSCSNFIHSTDVTSYIGWMNVEGILWKFTCNSNGVMSFTKHPVYFEVSSALLGCKKSWSGSPFGNHYNVPSGYAVEYWMNIYKTDTLETKYTSFSLPLNKYGMYVSKEGLNLSLASNITGVNIEGIQPANTSRRFAFKVDDVWCKFVTSNNLTSYTALATQDITIDSILAEGNTADELGAITNFPTLAGKMVFPAIALYASYSAQSMPTAKMSVDYTVRTNVYSYTGYSQEYVLAEDGKEVTLTSVVPEVEVSGQGAVTVTASIKVGDEWTEYLSLSSLKGKRVKAIKLKAVYTVSTIGNADEYARLLNALIIYTKTDTVVSGTTAEIVTETKSLSVPLSYVHTVVKHTALVDANIDAYVGLRPAPNKRERVNVGTGNGDTQTITFPDSGIDQNSLKVYFDNVETTSFGFNTETSELTFNADRGVNVSASYNYGWSQANWVKMTKESSQALDENEKVQTRFTYTVPNDGNDYKVASVKYSLERPTGTVTNEVLGVGTGKRQVFVLPHYAKTETIECNGSWSYNYDSRILTIIAPEGANIVISYDYIAETPEVDDIAVGYVE